MPVFSAPVMYIKREVALNLSNCSYQLEVKENKIHQSYNIQKSILLISVCLHGYAFIINIILIPNVLTFKKKREMKESRQSTLAVLFSASDFATAIFSKWRCSPCGCLTDVSGSTAGGGQQWSPPMEGHMMLRAAGGLPGNFALSHRK